ncbi:MAG: hypothetical protein F7B18_04460 [Desulfurococcales archaeon]|nr:hypothetical protein [Desulfurococcales archaeon]
MRRLLAWIVVAARLLRIIFKTLSLYLLFRLKLWAKSQWYKARFKIALRIYGVPGSLRRELGNLYGSKLKDLRPPGIRRLISSLFKHRERD